MQVRARSRVQCNFSTIKLQEGQRGEAKETKKIKATPKNPTGSKASNHEKGKLKRTKTLLYLSNLTWFIKATLQVGH